MKKSIIVGMLVVVFCSGIVACDQLSSRPMKWEYKVLDSGVATEAQLNELGRQGWELVSSTSLEFNGSTVGGYPQCYLKRPLAQ